jgi:hypothetical protein
MTPVSSEQIPRWPVLANALLDYCPRIVVSVQRLFAGADAVPVALYRITPVASEQNARCPVVPTVLGVAMMV